jgi:hypothetical protein
MALGGTDAVGFLAAKYATQEIPWWLIILGLIILFIGLILALVTIGKKKEQAEEGASSASISGPQKPIHPPGLPHRDKAKVEAAQEKINSYPTEAKENIDCGKCQDESAEHAPSADT